MRLIQARVRSTIQRFGQHDEAANIAALHDLKLPITGASDESTHLRPGVTASATIRSMKGKRRRALPAAAVFRRRHGPPGQARGQALDIGGVDVDVQQQALRVDEDMALATEDFLPGIVT